MEVRRTSTQNHPMGFDGMTLSGKGDVREVLVVAEVPEALGVLLLELVPPQAVIIGSRGN